MPGRPPRPHAIDAREAWWLATIGVLVLALVTTFLVAPPSAAEVDPSEGVLDDVPSVLPGSIGDVDLTTLQYGDPAEHLAVLPPPRSNDDGTAALSMPLVIPEGRAGVQPGLALQYDSAGGTSWMGRGWDLSLGEIAIDTTFGAPRFDPGRESESYTLDGELLFPNAVRGEGALDVRIDDRDDFVRQVEGPFERIIRYGSSPGSYYWRVTDRDGTDRWYGGSPDGREPSAILETEAGNGTRWGLHYVEDISGNTMTVTYDVEDGVQIGATSTGSPGRSMYLDSITYTGFDVEDPSGPAVHEPAYRIDFEREAGRPDVGVDASRGVPDVTRDLLDEVRITSLVDGDELVGGYDFTYATGPFDTTLLQRIGQFGRDEAVFAEHELTWLDESTSGAAGGGFAAPVRWGAEGADPDPASITATSAIDQSNRLGGDGGAYIGFNPLVPQKTLSIGGSFMISGGETIVQSSMMDLDGDGLPDLVTVDGSGNVQWRRNTVTPDNEAVAGDKFDTPRSIGGIDSLGRTRDFKIDLAVEAYPIASVQVGGGFGFDFISEYFADVNADGRPDFIDSGSVYFNTLASDGGISFVASSNAANTGVELLEWEGGIVEDPAVAALMDAVQPRFDTVRRWVAPFDGMVEVTGEIALTALDYGGEEAQDGVQVSIERHDVSAGSVSRPYVSTLDGTTSSVAPSEEFQVARGDEVFFRVHAIDEVLDDEVSWSPTITYTSFQDGSDPGSVATDANGRSQVTYVLADDFTTFGRTGDRTPVETPGEVEIDLALRAVGDLSDDVRVRVRHGIGERTEPTGFEVVTIDPAEMGDSVTASPAGGVIALEAGAAPADGEPVTLSYTFTATEPAPAITDADGAEVEPAEQPDWFQIEVLTDTPVDPTAIELGVTVTRPSGAELPDPDVVTPPDGFVASEPIIPSVRVFAVQDEADPYVPVSFGDGDERTLDVELLGPALVSPLDADAIAAVRTEAVLTVKAEVDEVVQVVERSRFTVAHDTDLDGGDFRLRGGASLTFEPTADVDHWIEVSVAEPGLAELLFVATETVTTPGDGGEEDEVEDIDVRLHHPDVQGVFPSGNRGWGVAGYNADHEDAAGAGPLVVGAFEIEVAAPDGYELDEDLDVDAAAGELDISQVADPSDLENLDVSGSFPRAEYYLPTSGPDSGGRTDRWASASTESLYATASEMRASRVGEAILDSSQMSAVSGSRKAPELQVSKGDFAVALGLGPASLSGAFGGGGEITGFDDLNGDGLPDIRSALSVDYTGPRGDNIRTGKPISRRPAGSVVSVGGGFGASPVSATYQSSGGGATRAQGTASSPAQTTSKKRGMNIGLGFGIQSTWTNPLPSSAVNGDENATAAASELGDTDAGISKERVFADMNGDGIADIVDSSTSGALQVSLGTGYGYAAPVNWANGVFNSAKTVSGSLSLGFQTVSYEFAGGAGGTEAGTVQEMMWADLDGDGVLDRFTQLDGDGPTTRWGSAEGLTSTPDREERFGSYPEATIDFVGNNQNQLPDLGTRAAFSRSTSASGGFDFSVYIGPLCLVACYVVINPGAHFGGERSTTEIALEDMNGDGYLDVVESKSTGQLSVRLNTSGRTNLLDTVTTPLGATYDIDYERSGPTLDRPDSKWLMSQVAVDDGRPGDGEDVTLYRFSYEGSLYDRALRRGFGFSTVTEQVWLPSVAPDGTSRDEVLQRFYTYEYANDGDPFTAGLMTRETYHQPDSTVREERDYAYAVRALDVTADDGPLTGSAPDVPAVGAADRFDLLDVAAAPLLTGESFARFDGQGDGITSGRTLQYDDRGNPTEIRDQNSLDITSDDVVTTYEYPQGCGEARSRSAADGTLSVADGEPPRDTWVQVPSRVTVADASGEVLRDREGGLDLCLNAVPIRIVELQGEDVCGEPAYAVTEFAFDPYGSYGAELQPANVVRDPATCGTPFPATAAPTSTEATFLGCDAAADAADSERLCLTYEYDPGRWTDVATVTDGHGVTSDSAFDPLTGRLAVEVDPNGNPSAYCYDAAGRLEAIVSPRELADAGVTLDDLRDGDGVLQAALVRSEVCAGATTPTVAYAYGLTPGNTTSQSGHAWATASHYDRYATGDTIDTATFVDGIGRVVQRKRDADVAVTVETDDGPVTVDVPTRVVEGAVEYDVIGREIKEWYPVVEVDPGPGLNAAVDAAAGENVAVTGPVGAFALTTYNTATSSDGGNATFVPVTQPTRTDYDVLDRVTAVRTPDEETTTWEYDVTDYQLEGAPIPVSAPIVTDPLGKATQRFIDVRGATLEVRESPAPTHLTRTDGEALLSFGDLPEPGTVPSDAEVPSTLVPSTTTELDPLVTTFRYDALVRLVQVVDTAGGETTHEYDLLDNRTATTNIDTGRTERRFTPAGRIGAELDAVRLRAMAADARADQDIRRETRYEYDLERLVTIDFPDVAAPTQQPGEAADGLVTRREVTPDVTYRYGSTDADVRARNAVGRLVDVVDGAMTRSYDYDVDGNVARESATRAVDPFGLGEDAPQATYETEYEYDSLGRLRAVTYPALPTAPEGEDGQRVTYAFDRGGSPSAITATIPQPDVELEDGLSVDREDREYTYVEAVDYDEFGEVLRVQTGTGIETTVEREPELRRTVGITTDARPVEPYYADETPFVEPATPTRELQRLRYRYDAVGNVLEAANTLYGAPDATSLATEADFDNGLPGPSRHAYAYDQHYRLVEAVSTYVDRQEDRGLTYSADYGPNGVLVSKAQEATTVSTTGNSRGGGPKAEKDNSNSKKNRQPDDGEGSTTPDQCDDNQGSGGGLANQDPTLTYRIADTEYESATSHRMVRAGSRDYTYDANGSQTGWRQPCSNTVEAQTHTWDADNRIVAIAQGTEGRNGEIRENATTRYRYNAEGERALKRRPSETFFVNEHWRVEGGDTGLGYASIYLGSTRLALHRTELSPAPLGAVPPCDPTVEICDPCDPTDYRCAESEVATGACTEPGVVRLVADDGATVCQPLHQETVRFLHPDALGSMRVATDDVGDVFQYVDYTPTGRPWVAGQSSVKDTPYLFAGGWTDNQFDLVNFGERWYDPREEQFLSVEPLIDEDPMWAVADPTILQAYTYADSNPLRFVDPDGRRSSKPSDLFSGGQWSPNLSSGDRAELGSLPAFTYVPKAARNNAQTWRPSGPFTNNEATFRRLKQSRFATFADRLDKATTIFRIELGRGSRNQPKVDKVRISAIRVFTRTGGTSSTQTNPGGTTGTSPQAAATSPAASTSSVAGASASSAPATNPPPRPLTPPPPPPPPPPAAPRATGVAHSP